MSGKTKIILFSSVFLAIVLFVIAFFMSNNKKYIITFDTNGGSYIEVQEVKKGETVTKPIDPTKEGYKFVTWNYENKEYDFFQKVKSDMTLEAVWEEETIVYNVTFKVEEEEKVLEIETGQMIDKEELTLFEKIGFEVEWYDGEEVIDLETYVVEKEITLTGKYVEVKTYTITFNTDGGTLVEKQIVNENKYAKEPTEPEKEGYVFEGWYLNNQEYDFNEKVTSDITLVAKWVEDSNVKRYEVKFNSDGGSNVASQKVMEGKKAKMPTNPVKNGYKFEGWYLNNQKYDFNKEVTSDVTLVAKWKEVKKYTVKFNTNGGNEIKEQIVNEDEKVSKPADPTKAGYIFAGWDFDFNKAITKDITINARWRKLGEFVVTFETDGGNSIPSQTIKELEKVTKPSNPTKAGYIFKEWQLNGNTYDFNSKVTGNITLKAVYTKEKAKYTVTFNTNGGNSIPSQTITEGEKVTKPANPTKAGSVFKGWQLNGNTYDFNSKVEGNITLNAIWEEKQYKIVAEKVDAYSVDVILRVFDGATEITNIKSINYSDGVLMCSGDNLKVALSVFNRESSFLVNLNDGTTIKAVK